MSLLKGNQFPSVFSSLKITMTSSQPQSRQAAVKDWNKASWVDHTGTGWLSTVGGGGDGYLLLIISLKWLQNNFISITEPDPWEQCIKGMYSWWDGPLLLTVSVYMRTSMLVMMFICFGVVVFFEYSGCLHM